MKAVRFALIMALVMAFRSTFEQALFLLNAVSVLSWRSELNPPVDNPQILAEQYSRTHWYLFGCSWCFAMAALLTFALIRIRKA
jgi:hypothetical protein